VGTLATIYQDNNVSPTPLANPFYAGILPGQSSGQWLFYAADGRYDVTMTNAGLPGPVTYFDILLCDPFAVGSSCGGGGGGGGCPLLGPCPINVNVNGTLVGRENTVDFIPGTNVTITPATDSGGAHLTFNSAGGGGSLAGFPLPLENCTGDATGGVFWTRQPFGITGGSGIFTDGHWEWSNTVSAPAPPFYLNCKFQLPHTLPSISPNLVLTFAINDAIAGHTGTYRTCDAIVSAGAINASTFNCTASQTLTTTTTAYQRQVKTFAVQSAVVADNLLEIQIEMVTNSGNLAADVIMDGAYLAF